ncbi:bifunctional response regulator/alkaline phosphatase family protein [candidate division WOR-3 bacterium]|nr:bifunctional response regulator/alkaline phosphatase family protein [candidate division WOR-3 bacterium]
MRILWIDDEIDMFRPFVYALQEKGYEVQTATNGPDGLALARTQDFDLVLLDEIMTGMDGIEVLRRLKEADPNLLVAMVTKSDEEALINEAFGKLVDDFIIKPFTPVQLLATLKRLLERRTLVSNRIAQEYMAAANQPRPLDAWSDWVEHYRLLNHWQRLLGRYADAALQEVQNDRRREASVQFGRFVEDNYRIWLSGNGPTMSHQFIERHVRPCWQDEPVYLIVFDSMRVDQWEALFPLLRDYFDIKSDYYCSILPTATPYARNAIFSGLLPLEIHRRFPRYWVFDETGQNRYEAELLAELLKRLGFKGRHAYLKMVRGEEIEAARVQLLDSNLRFVSVVINFLDLLIHSVRTTRLLDEIVPDDAALVGLTRVWFASSPVFEFLKALARHKCRVVVTSDHGFLRVKRPTLIHGSREISANLRYKHGAALRVEERDALLVGRPEDYMLPTDHLGVKYAIARSDYYFIYPTKPREYEKTYKYTFQHGGVSLEEMIVPVATLTPR